jgi:hypothetical protein
MFWIAWNLIFLGCLLVRQLQGCIVIQRCSSAGAQLTAMVIYRRSSDLWSSALAFVFGYLLIPNRTSPHDWFTDSERGDLHLDWLRLCLFSFVDIVYRDDGL